MKITVSTGIATLAELASAAPPTDDATPITEPGLYLGYSEDAYHADPCPEPSASRSIIKLIAERTPAHAFAAHPRLNPAHEEEQADKFDMGSAFHTLVLSRGRRIAVGPFGDWRTNEAKAFKAQARAMNHVPLLTEQFERVSDAYRVFQKRLDAHGLGHLFKDGQGGAEVVAAWRDPVAGWSRVMIDWLEADLTVTDLKMTGVSLDDESIGRHMSNMGYEVQHAFYERGLVSLYPELAGRFKFRFIFVEDKEPYAVRSIVLPGDAITKGHAIVSRGVNRWAEAKRSGEWPAYSGGDFRVEYPAWSVAEFE